MNRRRWQVRSIRWTLALLIALTVISAACQSAGGRIARVYASFPLRGPKIGGGIVNGIQLAFDEIESRVGSTEIVLVIRDNGDEKGQWQAAAELAIVQEAVNDPLAVAYLGPMNSGAAKLSLPITNRAGMVQISPSTTWPGLTKVGFAQGEPAIFYPTGRQTFYRTCSTDDVQGPAAAVWAKELGFQSYYVLDDGEAYGAGVAALFARRAEQIGLTNLGHTTIDKTAKDFQAVLTDVKNKEPDVVYFGGTVANGAALILQQMRAMGMTAAFMGPDAIVDTSLLDIGPAAEGAYATFVGVPPDQLTNEAGQKFFTEFRQKYDKDPEAYSQLGYDAARVLIDVMKQAPQINRASVLAGMSTPHVFNGTAGPFRFDANGDTTVTLVSGNMVKDGAFKFAKVLNARQ